VSASCVDIGEGTSPNVVCPDATHLQRFTTSQAIWDVPLQLVLEPTVQPVIHSQWACVAHLWLSSLTPQSVALGLGSHGEPKIFQIQPVLVAHSALGTPPYPHKSWEQYGAQVHPGVP